MRYEYDVIVVGGGHAGCEAAHAAARLGVRTLLITMDITKFAQMSCNPAVGGIAKGQIVREIDALGGLMGIITDRSSIQFRMLNRSKGPAMWSPRSQCDRMVFSALWRHYLERTEGLNLWQGNVNRLIFKDGQLAGVATAEGAKFSAKRVVLTAGTFLNGLMHIGRSQFAGGRISEPSAVGITEQLAELGFEVGRMKTGTPVRIDGASIDWAMTGTQPGDDHPASFSYLPFSVAAEEYPLPLSYHCDEEGRLPQRDCYMVYTNLETHDVLRRGLPDSPLYNGQIQSIGPRYCPSIETKIVTFADKAEHQLFIEPEGVDTQEFYLNGFSSSLPIDIQVEALQTIPAFKNVQIYRPGYAIEYDYFDPRCLRRTLETRPLPGLYFAGQINGTTGYEEAAGQGLIAGVNAALAVQGRGEFVLGRDEAYIGVLIDDLITKGVDEPYRMFTSRAEYRILLRQDDADVRLTPKAYEIGLATEERMRLLNEKITARDALIEYCREMSVTADVINPTLLEVGTTPLKQTVKLADLLTRPQLNFKTLAHALPALYERINEIGATRRSEIVEAAEILVKYDGYIARERLVADKLHRLEDLRLRSDIDYDSLQSLSTEARQKLSRHRPETIGQASRIPGVSPNDVNILLLLMNR